MGKPVSREPEIVGNEDSSDGREKPAPVARPTVVLYTRAKCHLCDVAKETLGRVKRRIPFDLQVVDVDGDPALAAEFGEQVPVVFVNGRKAFKFRIDSARLEERLRER